MISSAPRAEEDDPLYFSLVQRGPLASLRERLPGSFRRDKGPFYRTATLVAVTWVPIMIAAIVEGRATEGSSSDPLLRHFGVHARLLISIPLLIVSERVMENVIPGLVRNFTKSGLVNSKSLPAFLQALRTAEAFRDSWWGTALVVAAMAGSALSLGLGAYGHEMSWTDGGLGFAGTWYMVIARPIFAGLVAVWVWRMLTSWVLLNRISRVGLDLVPTHPDQAGGLGFVEQGILATSPLVLAISVVLAGRWGHDVYYHEVSVNSLMPMMAAFVVMTVLLLVGPLLLLGRPLWKLKRENLLKYGSLVGAQGRLVHRKWIDGNEVGEAPILTASEIGPVADAAAIYNSVSQMNPAPITRTSILPLAIGAALPMLPVFAIEIPIKEMLSHLAAAIF